MSIATQIQRLQTAKSDIKDAIEAKGVTVPSSVKLDDYPEYILQIGGVDTEPNITSYIIDQRIQLDEDNNPIYKVPEEMIIGVPAKDCNATVEINGQTVYKNVLKRIRANSHNYLGSISTNVYGTGQISYRNNFMQLSDDDKSKYADGTSIDWGALNQLFQASYGSLNIFMKLPQFWWKVTELETDLFQVSFTMTESIVDNTWNEWDGSYFIGTYKCGTDTYYSSTYYSRPDLNVLGDKSWNQQSSNLGTGYNLVSYSCHQIMALLGMGWYGTTDITRYIGNSTATTTGNADSFGMYDTVTSQQTDQTTSKDFNNFWGLEDWFGGWYEIIGDLTCTISNDTATISFLPQFGRTNSAALSTIDIPLGASTMSGCPLKMLLGTGGHLFPTMCYTNSNYNRGFANFAGYQVASETIATRGGIDGKVGGLTYINFQDAKSKAGSYMTWRVMVHAVNPTPYTIVTSINDLITTYTTS